MTKTITLEQAVKNPQDLIDVLTYGCYRYNRQQGMSMERLAKILPNCELMEEKYQNE